MSEFEDQFSTPSYNLGELTEPISSERGELWNIKKDIDAPIHGNRGIFPGTDRYQIPPDIAAEDARRRIQGEIHSPKIHQLVESVFDTRPVNARDFYSKGSLTVNCNDDFNITPTQYDYTIPDGYIGILRGFSYYTDDVILPEDSEYITTTILVDGVSQPDYESMPFGQNTNGLIPTHILINENKTVSLKFFPTSTYATNNPENTATYYVTLYGNLLLSRGLPLEFENISQTKG